MVPELTAETEFRLKAHEMEIRKALDSTPVAVADLTVALAWQSAVQESIIRKATHRIAELEAREAIGQKPSEVDWLKVAREMKPRPWWVRAAWAVMPSRRSVRL
jgi:hypothetical protein